MFKVGYEIATKFTFPIVMSKRLIGGKCQSSIAAFVIVNKEGWFVTAEHVAGECIRVFDQVQNASTHAIREQAIRANKALDDKARREALKALGKPPTDGPDRCSVWTPFSRYGAQAHFISGHPGIDIAVGRIVPFRPEWVSVYPRFKDPSKELANGTSLCKLGFPFHNIMPTWNDSEGRFELPKNAFPIPFFPIEGILTRMVHVEIEGGEPQPFPLKWVETSTPGLKGQSGGPIVDATGTIWAIQVRTHHLPLGFHPPVPGGRAGEKEYQFLNVGVGVHPESVLGLLKSQNASYDVAPY